MNLRSLPRLLLMLCCGAGCAHPFSGVAPVLHIIHGPTHQGSYIHRFRQGATRMRAIASIVSMLLLVFGLQAQCPVDSAVIIIQDITVIPMTDTTTVLNHASVLIENGLITQVGDTASVAVPPDALVIDGTGRYLIPGLADMHAHLLRRDDALLLLANGVTTVCNMHGEPWHVTFRDSLLDGDVELHGARIMAPRLYTTGPIMNFMGHPFFQPPPIQNVQQAQASLWDQDSIGYDFYKPYTYLTNNVFTLLQAHAAGSGRFIKGHGNDWVGAMNVITSDQKCIEHFWGYLPNGTLDAAEQALEDSTIASGKWNCPTLIVRWNKEHLDSIRANEPAEVAFACPPFLVANWRNSTQNPQEFANVAEYLALLKRLHDSGAKLMLGTDNVTPYAVAGYAVHRELELFVQAGLTPHQALALATAAPNTFLEECGHAPNAGAVAVGRKADLVLLNADPLDDISNTRSIHGVFGRGAYYPANCLQDLVASAACGITTTAGPVHAEEGILSIRPNPVNDVLHIDDTVLGPDAELLVINGPGQVVLRSGRTSGIDVSSLARGTYYVLAIDEGNTFSSSFIKE